MKKSGLIDPLRKAETASVGAKEAVTSALTFDDVENCPVCKESMIDVRSNGIPTKACLTHRIVAPAKD